MSSEEQPKRSPYKFIYNDLEALDQAVRSISSAFVWDTTPQGVAYWGEVRRNLLDLRDQARMIEADNS